MNQRFLLITLLGITVCASGQAATFRPIDSTVNFIALFGAGAPLALFDDHDQTFSGGYLAIQAGADQVSFTPDGTDYRVSNVSGQAPSVFTLTGSDYFTLAAWSADAAMWLAPDAVSCSELSGSCALSWSGRLVELAVDLVADTPAASAPLPSTLFLLGSGAFGLAVVARRRSVTARLPAA